MTKQMIMNKTQQAASGFIIQITVEQIQPTNATAPVIAEEVSKPSMDFDFDEVKHAISIEAPPVREPESDDSGSDFIGKIGEHRVLNLTLVSIDVETSGNSSRYMHNFVDSRNRNVSWTTYQDQGLETTKSYKIDANIQKRLERNTSKITTITRGKIIE
jgi:hypothetical protein